MAGRDRLSDDAAWALVRRAREIRVAAVVDGRPLLRTMHAAVADGRLVLHGTPRSEKSAWLGAPVVAAAEEIVARVPSWMRHPDKACPATTYYRSAQVQGTVVALDDPEERARALQALMEHLQPEGGYRPLDAADPLYAAGIRGLGMWAIQPTSISAVEKLGQHLKAPEMTAILAGLWRRGAPGDLVAIEALVAAHPARPRFAPTPSDLHPRCVPTEVDVARALVWLRGTYWNGAFTDAVLTAAHHGSPAWVGLERDGRLVASARGISDGAKRAWIYDVVVDPAERGQGTGTTLMEILMDHPRLRDVAVVQLGTRDAMAFYARLGFTESLSHGEGEQRRTVMTRVSATAGA